MLRADLILRFFVRSIGVTVNHGMSLHKSHNVLGIAPVAIIDRQLPFEYTITSRSTDVVVMALPVQNINHSAFRLMFEREKNSRNNFNDWFRQLKLVLRVEKKMYVIEQPLPVAPAANSEANVLLEWNAIYDAYNEVTCLILGSMTPELCRQYKNSSPYDMIKELKAMFEKQAGVESCVVGHSVVMMSLLGNIKWWHWVVILTPMERVSPSSFLLDPAIKLLAINLVGEYGFVIRPCMVGLNLRYP
ncbi:hypothetical protein Tco_1429747 [Tanacetum coccineum]